jgi:hypothetical protein
LFSYLISLCILCLFGFSSITANGLGLCEEADLEAQMFNLAQMFIRNPNVQFSTEPAFSQNPC